MLLGEGVMRELESLLGMAQLRMERAVSTCASALKSSSDVSVDEFDRSIRRIVIAINTVAQALKKSDPADPSIAQAADILWYLGEGLQMATDGARN